MLPAVRELLYAPDHNLRWNAVTTLGRIGPASNARYLEAALPFYLERDPLALPRVLGEIAGLRGQPFAWLQVEAALASRSYLVRWAVLDVFATFHLRSGSRLARLKDGVLERLSADAHPLIRAEALYERGQDEAVDSHPLLRGGELTAELLGQVAEELSRDAPDLTFGGLRITLSNYLHAVGRRDYDLPLLGAFVRYEAAHPHPRDEPFDLAARSAAFDAWRLGTAGPPV
jgi:hypothetical protein